MGLDWVVEPKRINDNVDLNLLTDKIKKIEEEIGENWQSFLTTFGHEEPYIYPNKVSDDFNALDATKELRASLSKLQKQYDKHFVAPGQTINAPRIGEDELADKWVEDNWEYLDTTDENGNQMTKHEFVTKNFGQFIVEAANPSPGIGKVSGMMCSPTSFRGKVIGYVGWLSEDVRGRAYDSMEPDELFEYGTDLSVECVNAVSENDEEWLERERASVELVNAASEWCLFWSEHGHSMHAWY